MKNYLSLLRSVLTDGVQKPSGRKNMPDVLGLTHGTIEMDLRDGFPLLTTKKMFYRGIIEELLWIVRGETNIKSLVDADCNFWNKDAYGYYLKQCKMAGLSTTNSTMEDFVSFIKGHDVLGELFIPEANYRMGDLGPVYGHQWRNQNGVDQLRDVYDAIMQNPYGRYKIIDAWNKKDFPSMALPPCHILYQFLVEPIPIDVRKAIYSQTAKSEVFHLSLSHEDLDDLLVPRYYLDLNMYQRSCDMVLGVPFNIASMAFLLKIMAKATNAVARNCFWVGGHCDIYMEHIPAVEEQLSRECSDLPSVRITKNISSFEDILSLQFDDFEVLGYSPAPAIKAELFTGL